MEGTRPVLVEGADELEGVDQGIVPGLLAILTNSGYQLSNLWSSGLGVNGLGDGAHRTTGFESDSS